MQHYASVSLDIQTDETYQILGRKGLKLSWSYYVRSTGTFSGVSLNPSSQFSSFSNTLYYNLIDAN